jgi:predicted membrane protein
MENNKRISIGCFPPVTGVIIFLVFFFAKIFGYVDWSWWWVFSPLWIPSALIIGCILVFVILYTIVISIDGIKRKIRKWKEQK